MAHVVKTVASWRVSKKGYYFLGKGNSFDLIREEERNLRKSPAEMSTSTRLFYSRSQMALVDHVLHNLMASHVCVLNQCVLCCLLYSITLFTLTRRYKTDSVTLDRSVDCEDHSLQLDHLTHHLIDNLTQLTSK